MTDEQLTDAACVHAIMAGDSLETRCDAGDGHSILRDAPVVCTQSVQQ